MPAVVKIRADVRTGGPGPPSQFVAQLQPWSAAVVRADIRGCAGRSRREQLNRWKAEVERGALVARPVDQTARQIVPQRGIEHSQVNSDFRVSGIGGCPVGRTAARGAVPQVQGAIALLICHAFALECDGIGRAIMPQPRGAAANRTIAFARFGLLLTKENFYPPAMAAS